MKRRITGLILVIVMLVLSLASCAYSIAEDDMTKYASMSAEDKAAFEAILTNLVIKDGDFTTDEATRANKVLDSIYSTLASDVDTTNTDDRKTEGTPGAHDLVYYAYYCTAEIDGVVKYFFSANMKSSSATKVQLGTVGGTELAKKLDEVFKSFDFTGKAYESKTEADNTGSDTAEALKAVLGDVAYVTYTYSYTEVAEDGKETVKSGTITNERIVIGEKMDIPNTLASYLNDQEVNKSLQKVTITEEGKGEIEYSGIKINWIAKGEEAGTFVDKTFDTEKKVTATDGKSHDLKDVELTYHVYPVYYYSVAEFTAKNVINVIMGESLTENYLVQVLFGTEYANIHVDHDGHSHDEDDFTEEEHEKMETLEKLLESYKFTDGDKTLTLAELVEAIVELQSKLSTEKKDLDDTKSDLKKAETARDEAKAAADKEDATQADKDKLTQAEKALEDATKANTEAQEAYDKAEKERDEKVSILLNFEGVDKDNNKKPIQDLIIDGYKAYKYDSLEATYNSTIKTNLAKEIYYYLNKYIKVSSDNLPEKAVEDSYDQIFQNYQYEFYKQDASTNVSNYSKFNGDFKAFLVDAVTTDIKTVKTYDEALAAIREKAASYVEPIVRIYFAANMFDVLVDDKAFEEYKDDPANSYPSMEATYGENTVRYAHQFDKLMNHFLDSEEDDGVVTYKNVKYTFGDPASEKKETEEK